MTNCTHRILLTGMLAMAGILSLWASDADSLHTVNIETITIVSPPKEHFSLNQQPISANIMDSEMLERHRIESIKNLSGLTPNLFIPNYGSSLTSAIYIRGIGSRINTPAVGLYVDDIPYTEKTAFSFQFADVERAEILRGPQGTLYGRNTMGGLIRLYTRNPLRSPGTEIHINGTSADMSLLIKGLHRRKVNEKLGYSFGVYANEARGIYRNQTTGQWTDSKKSGGINSRIVWLPTEISKLDIILNYDHTDEGGYPYQYNGPLTNNAERYNHAIGHITNNRPHGYRRDMLNIGGIFQWQTKDITLSSITGYQWIDDDMRIDQDFLFDDIFTLQQKQHIHTINQELTLKGNSTHRWKWVTGVSGTLQWTKTNAPVNFYGDGVQMIQHAMDEGMKDAPVSIKLTDNNIHIPGRFNTPMKGIALFHQSDFKLFPRITLTMGLRFDHERQEIGYNTQALIHCLVSGMGLTNASGKKEISYIGNFHKRQTHLLPRLAINYSINHGKVYASFSKGVRSGGYNMQMFSEIIQQSFRTEEFTPEQVNEQISYSPEWSLNYEIGSHFTFFNGALTSNVALFFISTHNQQVSRFTPEGLGRILVNAGRTRSLGGELSMQIRPTDRFLLNLNYGYTNATFTHYDGGFASDGQHTEYNGNHIPFAPEHTINAGLQYTLPLTNNPWGIKHICFKTDYIGAGRIWWTEANDAHQPYYNMVHAGFSLQLNKIGFDFQVHNITNTHYDTFRFHSMNRDFSQIGRPRDFSFDIRWKL